MMLKVSQEKSPPVVLVDVSERLSQGKTNDFLFHSSSLDLVKKLACIEVGSLEKVQSFKLIKKGKNLHEFLVHSLIVAGYL